jgi:hypothetical protein
MQVILDTNIIVSDFYMRSSKFKFLFEFSKKLSFDILIPQVVLDEVINKYTEMFEKQFMVYDKSVIQLKPLLYGRNIDFLTFDSTMVIDEYKGFLNDLIESKKIQLIPYPKTSHRDIVLHELSGKKPFKENGTGYRDLLIIESIFEKYSIPEESIVFISNNSRDFGEEPNFYEDLFSINKKISNKFRFKIKNSLTGFIDEYITPIMKIDESIKTIPQMSEFTGLNISNWILKELKDIIYDNGVGYAIMGLDEGYGTVMLHKIDSVKSLTVDNVVKLDEETITCNIILDGNFVMYVTGDQDDFMHSESWHDFFDYDPSEGNVDITTWPLVSAKITLSIVIDVVKGEITSYSPLSVKGENGWVEFDW